MEDTEKTQIAEGAPEKAAKKKRPLPLKILFGFLWALAGILLIVIGWGTFSALDKAKPLEFLPENYTAVVHTDNIFQAAAPIVELNAADTFLAEPQFVQFRDAFMSARDFLNSSNFFLNKALSRRIDAAIYPDQGGGFVAVVDLSYLSAATRLANFAAGFLKIENLSSTQNHFEYTAGASTFYIKPYKNLAIVSGSKDLFEKAIAKTRTPTKEEIELIEGEKTNSIKIIANAKKITEMLLEGNDLSSEIVPLIKENFFTSVQLAISNDDIAIQLRLPLSLQNQDSAIAKLLHKVSTAPKVVSQLTNETQYYTMMDFGSLQDLKEAAFQLMRKSQDIDSLWKKVNGLCSTLFSLSLEDIIFSWTGSECVAIGIEGSSEPVFALQIADEQKRREVFEKLSDSILLNTNTNLIVGGMRLPCFELPSLLSSLVSAFGINLPRPYYLVNNGFVYFSMSPQNLSAIYTHAKEGHIISRNENWKHVSEKSNANASIGLFYNLKRSMPFFIENSSIVAKILRLYNIGRCDISLDGETIGIQLYASSIMRELEKQVPGFPIPTGKPANFTLHSDSKEKPENVFWMEDGNTIKAFNLKSLEQHTYKMKDQCYITAVQDKPKEKGLLWAVTANGEIYLFDKNLRPLDKYPIITGETISAPGAIYKDGLTISCASGKIILISSDAKLEEMVTIVDANIKATPSVSAEYMALYNRGFEGEIYLFENGMIKNLENPMLVDGIGFGSPCVANYDSKTQVAFITQSGVFYLFENNELVRDFPIEIDDVFYTNAVYLNKAYYVLSENAILYKITADGTYMGVQLPNTTSAKEGILTVNDAKENNGVYVSGDDNILYGFNSSLELKLAFPLGGRGTPVFADVNNDKKIDCMVLSISRELNTWNLN